MGTGSDSTRGVAFTLPSPPPSMNSMYNVLFGMRMVELKPEVRLYKTQMKVYVPGLRVEEKDRVGIELLVEQDWYCKNGAMKKQDVQNMAKVLIDLIAEKQGWDDSHVWEMTLRKVQSKERSQVIGKVWVLNEGTNYCGSVGVAGPQDVGV